AQIHELLKIKRLRAEENLDRISRLFWKLTKFILDGKARFNDKRLGFELEQSPCHGAPAGNYHLIRKGETPPENTHIYRLTHPLGEYVLDAGRRLDTVLAELSFNLTHQAQRIS
ncbi:MAG: ATP-dependent helicase, partial [Gammaproteobacteria bacterium]